MLLLEVPFNFSKLFKQIILSGFKLTIALIYSFHKQILL